MRLGIATLFFVLCSYLAIAQLTGKVVGIADGDTFTLLTEDKQQVRVRVYGIDCPEKSQDFGNVAKRFTSDLIYGKEVYITDKGEDKYGRTLGIVYSLPDSICLNEALLKAGLAWHYRYFDNNEEWDKLEQEARDNKYGLWQMSDATAPWEYRKHAVSGY